MSTRLSVCAVVSAPPARLSAWLSHVRSFADEVVLSVDAASDPGTLAVAEAYADDVAVVDLDGLANPAYGWTAERATGDWILALDDDEVVAPSLIRALPALLSDNITHYHLPVRWVVPAAAGGLAWIRQFPWYPNHATRLFRNLRGAFRHPPQLHGVWEVLGEGRALPAEEDAIYHLNLALLDRGEREWKIHERYRRHATPGLPTCEEYYLYEDYRDELELVPCGPDGVLDSMIDPAAGPPGAPTPPSPVVRADIDRLHAHACDRSADPPIWSAWYVDHDTPSVLATNRGHAVRLRVANTSAATWRSCGDVAGRVVVSYRWRDPGGDLVVPQGDVTLLPSAVAPGAEAEVVAGLWTPSEPGRYVLEWEVLCERVAWFSDRGVPPLAHEVTVADRGVRPRAPHFAQPLPSRAHLEAAVRSSGEPPAAFATQRSFFARLRRAFATG